MNATLVISFSSSTTLTGSFSPPSAAPAVLSVDTEMRVLPSRLMARADTLFVCPVRVLTIPQLLRSISQTFPPPVPT